MDLTIDNIQNALKEIFDAKDYSVSTLKFIQPDMIKDAFRKKAKLFHPDRALIVGISEDILNEKFKKINDCYQFLISVVSDSSKINHLLNLKINIKPTNVQPKKQDFKTNYYTHKKEEKQNYQYYKKHQAQQTNYVKIYFSGIFPKRRLRFSEYLYYSKLIDWHTMIRSLVWQYKLRPRIGEIGVDFNFLKKEDITDILKNIKPNEKFGDTAVRMQLLTNFQLNVILGKQKNYNLPIGKFFIEEGIFTINQISKLLIEHKEFNLRCGTFQN
ncbi:MAG: hypothetical protein A2086_16050 [Spirochaetes bacterium GWD1_27_9]|nr:MAG: hypothetical protein A2Z98_15545 [Spirochaetes bacterium GWB1_27_13]OHD36228.1 MAG: hypothetical protein A2086_16050 [Spirochaetes bacterium GWD1_27_9]